LEECLVVLGKSLPPETLADMRARPEKDMILYHHGLGTSLRNEWGLWAGGPLYRHFAGRGLVHPDDMSGVILHSFWRYLHDRPLDVEGQIKGYQEYTRVAEYPESDSNPECRSGIEIVLTQHRDRPDGRPRMIHMGQCCSDQRVWAYEVDRGWYLPDAPERAAWDQELDGRYDACSGETG
jgi:hypothetical protein